MASSARAKSRGAAAARGSKRGATAWYAVAAVVVVLGVILVAANRAPTAAAPVANKDHWHAAFGVNVCGQWFTNAPEFHAATNNPAQSVGVHSHGDGLIHLHPYVTAEAGENATVGLFLSNGGWSADADSFRLWDAVEYSTGDDCPDGEPGVVRWSVNGEEREGDISDFRPSDGDVIVLGMLPEGQDLGTPPSAEDDLATPSDVEPDPGATVPGASVQVPTTAAAPGAVTSTTAAVASDTTVPPTAAP